MRHLTVRDIVEQERVYDQTDERLPGFDGELMASSLSPFSDPATRAV